MPRKAKASHLLEIPEFPAVMQKAIDHYFLVFDKTPTMSGLANYLCFTSRQQMIKFGDDPNGDMRSGLVKKAILRIEEHYEKKLNSNSYGGAIFALKNFGWRDTQEVNLKGGFILNIGRKSGPKPKED